MGLMRITGVLNTGHYVEIAGSHIDVWNNDSASLAEGPVFFGTLEECEEAFPEIIEELLQKGWIKLS